MRATMALEQMEWNRCESECRSRSTYVQWCIRIARDSHSDSRTERTAPKNKKLPFCDYYFIVFVRIRYWHRTSSFCNFIRKYISSDQSAWIALKHFLPSTNIPIFVLANWPRFQDLYLHLAGPPQFDHWPMVIETFDISMDFTRSAVMRIQFRQSQKVNTE